jgi:hypothetical protein
MMSKNPNAFLRSRNKLKGKSLPTRTSTPKKNTAKKTPSQALIMKSMMATSPKIFQMSLMIPTKMKTSMSLSNPMRSLFLKKELKSQKRS